MLYIRMNKGELRAIVEVIEVIFQDEEPTEEYESDRLIEQWHNLKSVYPRLIAMMR